MSRPRPEPGAGERGAAKVARIPVKVEPTTCTPRKPSWIRARSPVTRLIIKLGTVFLFVYC